MSSIEKRIDDLSSLVRQTNEVMTEQVMPVLYALPKQIQDAVLQHQSSCPINKALSNKQTNDLSVLFSANNTGTKTKISDWYKQHTLKITLPVATAIGAMLAEVIRRLVG